MAERSGSDEAEGTNKKSFPGRLFSLFGSLVLLVLLGYGVSNLWLMSPWGKGMIERKLGERTGFVWEVGSISWSPWNGCSMRDVMMLLPDELGAEFEQPAMEVTRIRVMPYWSRILRGSGVRPREVLVDSPRVTLSLEMLAAVLEDMGGDLIDEPPVAAPPDLAANSANVGPVGVPRPGPSPGPGPVADSLPTQQAAAAQASPPVVERPPAGLPMHLRVRDASVHIVAQGKGVDVLRMDQMSLDMPVFGEDAAGKIKVASLEVSGFPKLSSLEQVFAWKRPGLVIEQQSIDLGGVKLRFGGQLVVGRHVSGRFPFLVDMIIDPQQVESIEGLDSIGLHLGAGKLAGKFTLVGLLDSPMTWQAEMLLLGEGVSVRRGKEGQQGHRMYFDAMYLPAILHQGKLHWGGAKMIGEDLSVLGNGRVSMRGGIVAVTRLVASPEVAGELTKSLQRAGLADEPWWHDLDTPDRKVRDLTVSGSIYDPVVDAGNSYARVPLSRLLRPSFKAVSAEEKNAEDKPWAPLPEHGFSDGKQ